MDSVIKKEDNTSRTELRLSSSDKELFEYAKQLSGYATLSEFIRRTVREKAEAIVVEHQRILNSQQDQEIFFDALMSPPAPNKALNEAIALFKDMVAE